MKRRIFSVALALCLCITSQTVTYAGQKDTSQPSAAEPLEIAGKGENLDLPNDSELLGEGDEGPSESSEESGTGEGTVTPAQTPNPSEPPKKDDNEGGTENQDEIPNVQDPSGSDGTGEETVPKDEIPNAPALSESDGAGEGTVFLDQDSNLDDDMASAPQEISLQQENVLAERYVDKPSIPNEVDFSSAKIYAAMIALKEKDGYREGDPWTNETPYPDAGGKDYEWCGGPLNGQNILAVGCVAFAFSLSDAAFGYAEARMYAANEFDYEDIKVGDILRMNNDAHTVIVLEVHDNGVVVAEGNISTGDHKGKVHWERGITREDVLSGTSHYITRYPENFTPDDPNAGEVIAQGTLGSLTWDLTKAGTLTISGTGAIPDYSGPDEQPWGNDRSKIRKVVIGNGVTSIGSCAFWNSAVMSAEISLSVQTIGNSAFRESKILSVKIPSGVKTIGDDAFRGCLNLSVATISDGLETIGERAFQSCASLKSISLPASIGEVGAGAFYQCQKLTSAAFASGDRQVKMGDNIFSGCWYLASVTLPQNIDRIGDGMFMNCQMLAGVEIPQGAESIGNGAFSSCSGFTTVIIPDSVSTIGSAAFSACALKDIYFTGTEEQWNRISKIGDTLTVVSKVTIHYNYKPPTSPDTDEGNGENGGNNGENGENNGDNSNNNNGNNNDNGGSNNNNNNNNNNGNSNNNNSGSNPGNSHGGDMPGSGSGNSSEEDSPKDNNLAKNNSEEGSADVKEAVETWRPTTPDEIRRYAFVGTEAVRCTLSRENAYTVDVENAVQGPMCFRSFEAVLGDYRIGRTYDIYARSRTTYSTDEAVRITIEIPSAIYQKDRAYKMICVTKGGQPFLFEDLDSNPGTITIETDKFHAYALIYK